MNTNYYYESEVKKMKLVVLNKNNLKSITSGVMYI